MNYGENTSELIERIAREVVDAAFVLQNDHPHVVQGNRLLIWTPAGYDSRVPRPTNTRARVITPPSLLAVLATGWQPAISIPLATLKAGLPIGVQLVGRPRDEYSILSLGAQLEASLKPNAGVAMPA